MNSHPIRHTLIPLLSLLLLCSTAELLGSCVEEESPNDTPTGNFEALWKILDTRYCFFDYKAGVYGLDWNEVHDRYKKRISDSMSEQGLFEVLGDMLCELRDGHVNLYSSYDAARYWDWKQGYPANYSDTLQRIYLGTRYKMAGNISYTIFDDNIGYAYCSSFEDSFGEGNLDAMFNYFSFCSGIIIDVRNNGGGMITAAEALASRFTNQKTLVGYMSHKTGTGHNDFSTPEEIYLKPASGIRWQKRVIVLTNRSTYSAANYFVSIMHRLPLVTLAGDQTGGGSGLPFTSMLPNGWTVRFSACPTYDANMQQIEFGIVPDMQVGITSIDMQRGRDTIIEIARAMLKGELQPVGK